MPQKGRLPAEEKVKIVEAYKSGKLGAATIESKHGINKKTLRRWVQR